MSAKIGGGWVLVLVTTPTVEEAEAVSRSLLEKRLIACVNIVRDVKSLFWWRGKIDEAGEALLIMKTRIEKLLDLIRSIKEKHSYTVPEIIAIPILAGYHEYLKWLDESTGNNE